MGTDNISKRKRGERIERKINSKKALPFRYLIICEGEQTEPNYFNSIKKLIEEKYIKSNDRELIQIDVFGEGRNTTSLVDEAIKKKKFSSIEYGHIWCVFDRDSFTKDQFNSAIHKARLEDFKIAWSNESFELWFLLHFEYTTSQISRNAYTEKLNTIFKSKASIPYRKNDKNIYNFLSKYGNQSNAIKNAEKLLKLHGNIQPSEMHPATTVHKLVIELLAL